MQASALSATADASKVANEAASSVYSAASSFESAVRDYVDRAASQAYSLTDLYYQASDSASAASKSGTSVASRVSKSVPTDASSLSYEISSGASGASKSASSAYAQASSQVSKQLDDAHDYVFSSWDDSQLHAWLVEHNVIKSKTVARRDELLSYARDSYTAAVNAPYEAFSNSYLVRHPFFSSSLCDLLTLSSLCPLLCSTTGLSTRASFAALGRRLAMNT